MGSPARRVMRRFGTQGPVNPQEHYVVSRTEEIADYIKRVKEGKYVVLFAPRQTGKTTFFQAALETLTVGTVPNTAATQTESTTSLNYFPIQLNFDIYKNLDLSPFYGHLYEQMREGIIAVLQKRGSVPSENLRQFLENTTLTDHLSMLSFFKRFARFLDSEYDGQQVVLVIDEFDGIPQVAVSDFLHTLRHIYISGKPRCPHSVGIVGVKSIAQLNYDRSISPFNIQDEFHLPNFTLKQVQKLLGQYTDEVGQVFIPEVIKSIHKQTAGQPVLVNRFAQILTEELDIPKTEPVTMIHFSKAHAQLLHDRNTNIEHLTTNIRKNPRFENVLMRIMERDEGVDFNMDDDIISELATYGVIKKAADGMCEILSPIYLYRIMKTFKPIVNGLEDQYFSGGANEEFLNYITSAGHIDMGALLDNFRDFIARAGFKILQVPDTPQESVGRHLLLAYLDQFVKLIGGFMHIEVQTGRGRMDIIITHNQRKYIIETKIWRGDSRYQAGKKQLTTYLLTEGVKEGYYIVFDHREKPEPRVETETIEGLRIRSYVIPVMQEIPSGSPDTRGIR